MQQVISTYVLNISFMYYLFNALNNKYKQCLELQYSCFKIWVLSQKIDNLKG